MADEMENSLQDMDRAQLEADASGLTSHAGVIPSPRLVGQARAKILCQDREYAKEQENSRREFEQKLEAIRTEREKDRQKFEASLAADNREAALEAARMQATATREVAAQQSRIARAAARAAIAAAIAAFLSVVVTAFPIIKAAWFP